jgi:hypothetical protein
MDISRTLFNASALQLGLLTFAVPAIAAPFNQATYSVGLAAVQAPNTPAATTPGATGSQLSQITASTPTPIAVQVTGSADTGPNQNGYGYANGHAYARAEAGILKASAQAEAQAVAQPSTNVGASARAHAVAKFADSATFTASGSTPYQNVLIISGNLILDGFMSATNGFGEVKVGGTGLNTQAAFGEWSGDSNGRQKSAYGNYSSWVPGSTVTIPFSFTVYGGQATEINYWLDVTAMAGVSFPKCSASGGLCNIVETSNSNVNLDYSHTLAWGGVTATDWFGNAVQINTSSLSGFNYAAAYTPTVPVPAAAWLFGSGLLGLIGVARRKAA